MATEYLANAGISMDAVKGIFITHMHGDHTCGLIQFVDLISWYYKTANPTICLPNLEVAKVIESTHFDATCYAPHLKECKTKAVFVNHYQPQKIPSVLQLAEEMKDLIPVKLLYDGNEVTL